MTRGDTPVCFMGRDLKMRLSYKQEWPGDEATLDCNSGGWRFAPYLMLW